MKIYALCIERKITGRKTSQEYVRRSYSKLLTSSNAETKAWRWNETKRTLFPADEVTALSKDGQLSTKTTLNIYSTEIIPQGNRHECEGYGKQKALVEHRTCHDERPSWAQQSPAGEGRPLASGWSNGSQQQLNSPDALQTENNSLETNWCGGRHRGDLQQWDSGPTMLIKQELLAWKFLAQKIISNLFSFK